MLIWLMLLSWVLMLVYVFISLLLKVNLLGFSDLLVCWLICMLYRWKLWWWNVGRFLFIGIVSG